MTYDAAFLRGFPKDIHTDERYSVNSGYVCEADIVGHIQKSAEDGRKTKT